MGCGGDDDDSNNGGGLVDVGNNTASDAGTNNGTTSDGGGTPTDDAGTSTDDAGASGDDGGTDTDAGSQMDAGEEPPPFEPSISVTYRAIQNGQDIVTDRRSYTGDEVGSITCQIDERGLRLLMRAAAPACGNDEFRVLMVGYQGPETYTWPDNATTQFGTWTTYSPPKLRTQGQTGCFDRPILPRAQTITVTEDDWGRLTLDVLQTGRAISPNVAAGNYDTRTEFTLSFDPATCMPYDSGSPACTGATGEDLGSGPNTVYTTACANIAPGGICDDTDGCTTNLIECREPTNEECGGVVDGITDETERQNACDEFTRCVFVPAANGDPSRCDAAPVEADPADQCSANSDWETCNNDGCILNAECAGPDTIDCSALPDDDIACVITYPCVP
jgi:hypothetical protein